MLCKRLLGMFLALADLFVAVATDGIFSVVGGIVLCI